MQYLLRCQAHVFRSNGSSSRLGARLSQKSRRRVLLSRFRLRHCQLRLRLLPHSQGKTRPSRLERPRSDRQGHKACRPRRQKYQRHPSRLRLSSVRTRPSCQGLPKNVLPGSRKSNFRLSVLPARMCKRRKRKSRSVARSWSSAKLHGQQRQQSKARQMPRVLRSHLQRSSVRIQLARRSHPKSGHHARAVHPAPPTQHGHLRRHHSRQQRSNARIQQWYQLPPRSGLNAWAVRPALPTRRGLHPTSRCRPNRLRP